MSDEIPVRYGSAGRKIADFFMDLVPTTKVRVKHNRPNNVHLVASESEMEDIARALLAMRDSNANIANQ